MKWCPHCNNMMFPKNGKLACNACKYESAITDKDKTGYKISKTMRNDDDARPIVIREMTGTTKISSDDRKAYDDFFRTND